MPLGLKWSIALPQYKTISVRNHLADLVEPGDDPLDLAALPALEDEVGHVEHDALQEEDEGHPLVVRLVRHLVSVGVVGTHAGLQGCHRLSDSRASTAYLNFI